MPWSATITSMDRSSTRVRTWTTPSASLYLTAFSTRLPSAATQLAAVGRGATIGAGRRTTSTVTRSTRRRRGHGRSPLARPRVRSHDLIDQWLADSIRDSSSRSSIGRRRGAPRRPSGRPRGRSPPGPVSSMSASASTAIAPTGVFSSWEMLATKSVRIVSIAGPFADVLDRADRDRRSASARRRAASATRAVRGARRGRRRAAIAGLRPARRSM